MATGRCYEIVGVGTIRIQSESPYEHLDPELEKWMKVLKEMWLRLRNCKAMTGILYDFFSKSQDPFVSVLQMMLTSGDFYSGKQNSLAFNIGVNFSKWLKNKPQPLLPAKGLKYDAFNLIIRQKNQALLNLFVEIFCMVEDKEMFLEPIRSLIKNYRYKEACQCAVVLHLHEYFKLEDFILPLVFQERYMIAEKFLEGSRRHQFEIAVFLDDLLGKKNIKAEIEIIVRKLNIYNARVGKLYYKPLSKLVARIVKLFNLPPEICPNLTAKRGKGALQFLFHKRYVEKTIGFESWSEMAAEAVGDDPSLQAKLVRNVTIYGDLKEALSWAERFGVPEEEWPFRLKEFGGRLREQGSHSTANAKEENWDEVKEPTSVLKFHQLPIHESQIIIIDTASDFSNFLNDIVCKIPVVGIDAEWKPSFGFKKCDLALIQVATFCNVYILDVMALGAVAPDVLWERFANVLLSNPDILKLGFGINTDLTVMKTTLRKFHAVKTTDSGFLDLALLWKALVQNYNFVFPYPAVSCTGPSEGLSRLIELCLGERLDKSDQFSNWENRPLRRSQIIYAAIDAYCLLEVYNVIVKECESQNVPIAQIVNEIMNEVTPRKAKKKMKNEEDNGMALPEQSRKSVAEFRVLCDSMLAGLGKELRKCGVNTIIMENGQEPPVGKTAGKVLLNVLTQRRKFNELKKYGRVYCVKSSKLRQQVIEVLNYFNIEVKEGDVYSRCLACNSNEFETFSQGEMKKLINQTKTSTNLVPAEEYESCHSEVYQNDFYEDYEEEEEENWCLNWQKKSTSSQGPLYYQPGRTRAGALIDINAIPIPLLNRVPTFYVCVYCGKCYWNGSHKERGMMGFMGQVVNR